MEIESVTSTIAQDPTQGRVGEMTIGIFARAEKEFYETPPELSRPLLALEEFEGDVWEPACGNGALSRVLMEAGYNVVSTDLMARGYGTGGIDFLKEKSLRAPNIVTNPPFLLWGKFAEHALKLGAKKLVLMHKQTILGNVRTSRVMQNTGLTRVLVANRRVSILPPGAIDLGHSPRGGSFAWYVWVPGSTGAPTLKWFSPDRPARTKSKKQIEPDATPKFSELDGPLAVSTSHERRGR